MHALRHCNLHPMLIEEPMLERYFECEKTGEDDLYILSDDDIIPYTEAALWQVSEMLRKHPEIGILGLSWKRGLQKEEMGKWFRQEITPDIWEVDHCGGVMVIRRGILDRELLKDPSVRKLDYKEGIGDDKVIADIVRLKGYKVAITPLHWFHHLGDGQSTVWK